MKNFIYAFRVAFQIRSGLMWQEKSKQWSTCGNTSPENCFVCKRKKKELVFDMSNEANANRVTFDKIRNSQFQA